MQHIQKLMLIGLLLAYPVSVGGIDLSTCSGGTSLGYGMQTYCGDVEALSGTRVYQGGNTYAFDTSSGTIETAVYKGGCLTDDILSGTGLKLSSEICSDKDKPYVDPDSSTCACVECLTDAHCADRTDGKTSCDLTNKVCQQSGCTSNDDCETGYFCAFETGSETDKGTGECRLVFDYGPDSVTAAGFIRSTGQISWWSAQNWCTAQGKMPATRAIIGCSDLYWGACTSSTVDAFKSTWESIEGVDNYVWLEDSGDSRSAYVLNLIRGSFGKFLRPGPSRALCQ